VLSVDDSDRSRTACQYDDLGRQTAVSQLDGTISSSTTTDAYGVTHLVYSGTTELTTSYGYDADGDQMTVTDPLSQVTNYQYDRLNRLVKEIQPSPDGVAAAPVTQYTYDNDGNKLTETDPDENVTTFGYNSLNQLTSQSQTIALYLDGSTPVTTTAITGYQYDGDGNMVQETDADGQVTVFAYDALNRQTGQQWYANATDAAHSSDPSDVIVYTYDLDGELHSAADDFSSYTYTYNSLGQQTSVDNAGTPGVPEVLLSSGYDAVGNRTSLSATIGSTADFVNTYAYDALNRQTQVTQGASTIAGHDGVDSKLVNFTYNADGQLASIDRFNDLTGSPGDRVASSAYGYDDFGRLTSLTHTAADGTTTYAAYSWTYDAASQVTSFTNSANIADYSAENVASYNYDHDGQLTGATPPSDQAANASNSLANVYDANGNATSLNGVGTTIGAGDTLLFDGTYYDTYDANGNLIEQANATTEIINKWDNRNRLVSVTDKVLENGSWVKTEEIDYTYDVFNNLIGRQQTTYQSDGVTPATSVTQRNVFDGANMVLTFDGSGNLTDRYLWGPMVDQVLADEQFKPSGSAHNQLPSSAGNTLWSLGDNQNSVRDLVNDSGVLQEHIAYSPFGQQVAAQSTNPGSVVFVFGYTGTYTDVATADQLHGVRWYDPASQRWLSEDPIAAGTNAYQYGSSAPTSKVDPNGEKGLPNEHVTDVATRVIGISWQLRYVWDGKNPTYSKQEDGSCIATFTFNEEVSFQRTLGTFKTITFTDPAALAQAQADLANVQQNLANLQARKDKYDQAAAVEWIIAGVAEANAVKWGAIAMATGGGPLGAAAIIAAVWQAIAGVDAAIAGGLNLASAGLNAPINAAENDANNLTLEVATGNGLKQDEKVELASSNSEPPTAWTPTGATKTFVKQVNHFYCKCRPLAEMFLGVPKPPGYPNPLPGSSGTASDPTKLPQGLQGIYNATFR
jgi:RHS repeat-associated protein